MITKLKYFIKDLMGFDKVLESQWRSSFIFRNSEYEWKGSFNNGPRVGILWDIGYEHQNYIQACIDLEINYEVIDIRSSNWLDSINNANLKVFLVWPTIYKPIQKQFWDERLWTLKFHLNKRIFPSLDLMWIYESKRRTLDWLQANRLCFPETNVFFNQKQALGFLKTITYPIVIKTDQGARSSGVYIIRNQLEGKKYVIRAFRQGLRLKNKSKYDRHQGYLIFQEYLKDCQEWRMIRAGDSYFCRYKIKEGDFHSGSGDIVWAQPPDTLLNMTKIISQQFECPSVNVDFFKTIDGRYLINEIHTHWGGKVMHDQNLEGRYMWNNATESWDFEKGDFFKNRCANLKVEWIRDHWL